MALSTCRECGKPVSTEAKTCPNCGVGNPALPIPKPPKTAEKKRSHNNIVVLLLILFGLGAITNFFNERAKTRDTENALAKKPSAVAQQSTSATDVCRDKGFDIATAYIANMKQAAEVGMMASEMMNRGCQDAVGGQGTECVNLCKDGFKAKAKAFVKDGTL